MNMITRSRFIVVCVLVCCWLLVGYKFFRLGYYMEMFSGTNLKLAYKIKTLSPKSKEISMFQQRKVDEFCSKYGLTDTSYYKSYVFINQLDYRLLVNKQAKSIFCYVPKAGCTNLKVAFFMSQGMLDKSLIDIKPHTLFSHDHLYPVQYQKAFASVFPYYNEKQKALKEYFKFLMYRHPIERLASAYRDKLARLDPGRRSLREDIFLYSNPGETYTEREGVDGVSFRDFVSYWLDIGIQDEHFIPIFELCDPCRIRYTYYGQFKTFKEHATVLLHMIGGKKDFLLEDNYSDPSKKTEIVVQELYNTVPIENKRRILKRLSQDIDFYYHIYPDEVDTHMVLLNITDKLTLPYLPVQQLPVQKHDHS